MDTSVDDLNSLNEDSIEFKVIRDLEVSLDQKDAIEQDGPNVEKMHMIYTIDQRPSIPLCVLLGLQHYLCMFGATLTFPFILRGGICLQDDVNFSQLISTIFAASGINTLIQTTFGVRLPIIQGGTFTFLVPIFAILSLEKWQCPEQSVLDQMSEEERTEASVSHSLTMVWQIRMREIQGAIILSSLLQIIVGFTGVIGLLLRFIGPLTIVPAIALIGLSLFDSASAVASSHWGIAIFTIVIMTIFSQYLTNVHIPLPRCGRPPWCWFPVFKIFPVILSIFAGWILCTILTFSNVFPPGSPARVDSRISVIYDTPWFRVPYPGQWGMPTFSVAAVVGMSAAVLASMIESIGDYYAAARLSGAPPPPKHAINRGIFMEGIGCLIAGCFGTGTGTTSYSENIGVIGLTKVGSRIVIQVGALIMILLSLVGKFGAFFATIPEPVIGGMFCCTFSMLTAVGISNLQYTDMNTPRNLYIVGLSLFLGLTIPRWLITNPQSILTGSDILDQVLTVLLSTSVLVGGSIGFILDNTVPGTVAERGLLAWKADDAVGSHDERTYDIPVIGKYIRKSACLKRLPMSPTGKCYAQAH